MAVVNGGVVLGFDIGGTWVRGVRMNRGRVTRRLKFRTPATSVQLKRRLLRSMVLLAGRAQLGGVGFGVAGAVDVMRVTGSQNVPALRGFDFSQLGLPVLVDNDARVWLAGALRAGKLRQPRVLALTLGTGVGRAYARKGRVQRVKALESPEAWEEEYQGLRRRAELARYVAWQLRGILNRYRPTLLLVGGGVIDHRRGLIRELASELNTVYPKLSVQEVSGNEWLGCVGAAWSVNSGLRPRP